MGTLDTHRGSDGGETMRIGKGDIVALRILAGVPVAIGFAFLGLMVWTSIDPPPQQEPDPQAKARARIAVDYCIQNEGTMGVQRSLALRSASLICRLAASNPPSI
jgi:hypothetical protein